MSEPVRLADSPLPARPARGRRWGWWLLGIVGLVVAAVLVGLHFLDGWLLNTLQKQVSKQTHGQYQLRIADLNTSLLQRSIRLRGLRLRPAAQVADTLPRLRLDAAELHITGIGLLALLRKGVVPVDSAVLDSVRLDVLALATKSTRRAAQPLHQRLPLGLKGLDINYAGLQRAQVNYLPDSTQTTARLHRADLSARELLLSPAGAADSQRLGYAQNWHLHLQHSQARAQGHALDLAGLNFSTADRRFRLDSVRVLPVGAAAPHTPRLSLTLPRLMLTGLDAARLQHQHQLRVDSLLVQGPRLTLTPAQTAKPGPAAQMGFLRSVEVAQLAILDGYVHLAGTAQNPILRQLNVRSTAIRYDSAAARDAHKVLFAKSWNVALGHSQATLAAHPVSVGSMQLSTKTGTFDLRALRVRLPAPGQGKPDGARFDVTLPRLTLSGFDAAQLQHQRHFQARRLEVSGAKALFIPPAQPPPPLWQLLSKVARRSDLAELRVRNTEIRIGRWRHSPHIRQLNLTGRSIRIDQPSDDAPNRIAYALGWKGQSGRLSAPFDDRVYFASSERVKVDTDARLLRFEDMRLKPRYSPMGMNLHKGYQAPAVTIKVPSLTLTGLDYPNLVNHGDFRLARAVAQRPYVLIASDGRGPINPNLSKISPEEMRKLKVTVDVRRLDLVNGSLYTTYRSPRTPIIGKLNITRFNGSFFNLSNDRRRMTPATPLTGRATTYLQGQCRLDAQISAYLLDPKGRHRVWGTFGPGQFAIINSMTVPTRLVKFKKGDVQGIRFALQADRKGVTGTMTTRYTGLQMELLGYKDEEIKKTFFKRILSKAANVIVIRDQNPRKRGKLVSGEMTSKREPRFSVFTLWRQGVVSGLFDNVGVPQKLAQKLSESADEAPLPK
ncbi:hypothetical protein [Hymenobacter properus]|uniref:Uncharacterized protein n=1 Tax=Hymenobacter properus TaxID=2791026 RepID=A0A931BLE3_9BACT|nr:hypothetical protein [Hymenobacter properus]MBF9144323.1 hypothetical protein [Hymenobacter properus]MBR7723141.1 hypothetical protein [Microvirga sp. SRT04]